VSTKSDEFHLLKKKRINTHLAARFTVWKHSGFSVAHSIRVLSFSIKAREVLSRYNTQPPLPLEKNNIEEKGNGSFFSFASGFDPISSDRQSIKPLFVPGAHSVPVMVLALRKMLSLSLNALG